MMSSLGHPRHVTGFNEHGITSSKPLYSDTGLPRRKVGYEKEFHIGQTQVVNSPRRPPREVRDSMLAYSEHMRHQNNRKQQQNNYSNSNSTENSTDNDMSSLQVHAIPKTKTLPKIKHLSHHTKRLSLDNRLISRSNEDFDTKSNKSQFRSKTAPPPDVGSVDTSGSKKKEELQLKFVSASDLYEILSDKGSNKSSNSSSNESIPSAWESPRKVQTSAYVNSFSKSSVSDGPISGRTKRTYNRRSNKSKTDSIKTLSDSDSDNVSNTAEIMKKKQEEEAKKLLRNALAKLQEMEARKSTDPLKLPRLKRKKRVNFQKTILDAIPEAEREDSFFDASRRSSAANRYQNYKQTHKDLGMIKETDTRDNLPEDGVSTPTSPDVGVAAKKRQFQPQDHIRHSWSLLPPIASQEEFKATGPGDTFKAKRLNLKTKNRTKSKKIRFLKGE